MTDKELLEAAAKAAGVGLIFSSMNDVNPRRADTWTAWNPLTDDGDALRLVVKLELQITLWDKYARVWLDEIEALEDYNGDPYAATRRAIVRAAAAMAN